MGGEGENVTMSRWELEKEREHAVISARLEQLDSVIPELFATAKGLDEKITNIPLEIIACRDRMDKDMKNYIHDEFVTNGDLQQFESKLEKQIGKDFEIVNRKIGRATWIVSGFISAGTFIFFLLSHTNLTIL